MKVVAQYMVCVKKMTVARQLFDVIAYPSV